MKFYLLHYIDDFHVKMIAKLTGSRYINYIILSWAKNASVEMHFLPFFIVVEGISLLF